MRRKWEFKLLGILLILFVFKPVLAENSLTPEESRLSIISKPPGVTVYLEGEYSMVVTTPSFISRELKGEYQLKASKSGYEGWSSTIYMTGEEPLTVSFELSPKTRLKAALRSLIFPGWGQYYSGYKTKATFLSLAAWGGVLAFVWADQDFSKKNDYYVLARNQFESASNIEDKLRFKDILDIKQREAYDADNTRRFTLAAAIGIWAYNIADALFFFPSRMGEEPGITKAISWEIKQGKPTLVFTYNF
jgi:hypothetical protein